MLKYLALAVALMPMAQAAQVDISTEFPGGNGIIKNQGLTVAITPDLRGGRNWFYWSVKVRATKAGKVKFLLGKAPKLSVRGPAISRDGGKTWRWYGTENVEFGPMPGQKGSTGPEDAFYYTFKKGETVRFCATIPYMDRDLQAFLKKVKGNRHVKQSVLTRTRKGRSVELLQIGSEGPGKKPLLIACRHHACEAVASYTFEGFLSEAMSESPMAKAFRKKYVLYAIPMVDKDGVEAGDQGKNRNPHDHNRDYGTDTMYPEVKAIKALAKAKGVKHVFDFHDPSIRGESHAVFAIYGRRFPHNYDNTSELSQWMHEEGPQAIPRTKVWFKKPESPTPTKQIGMATSFAHKADTIISATLETPYTVTNPHFDQNMARAYGAGTLRAWARATFIKPGTTRKDSGFIKFAAFRKSFEKYYARKPIAEMEAIALPYLKAGVPMLYQLEANRLMGLLRLRHQKYDEAIKHFDTVARSPLATGRQRESALGQLCLTACKKKGTPEEVEKALQDFNKLAYPSPLMTYDINWVASAFFAKKGDVKKALGWANRCPGVASKYNVGKALVLVASLQDRLGQKQQAIASRKQAVTHLRKQLDPVPPGVFGVTMAMDLIEALNGIPTATAAEKKAAADIALNHKVQPKWVKDKIQKLLQK